MVSSASAEWREELIQATELVAEVMKDKLASLPRPRESPHTWEESWVKWPGQWAALLRIFLARAAVDVAESGKKAQGTMSRSKAGTAVHAMWQVVSFASGLRRPSRVFTTGT